MAAAQDIPAPSTPIASPSPGSNAPDDPCGGDARLLATLNRPTIGYSACAVPPKSIILEEGYQVQEQGAGATASIATQYPQSFARIGVKRGFEVDVIGPYYNKLASPDGKGGSIRTHGYQDSGLGFKYEFLQRGRYTLAVDGLYTAPNGSPGYTAGGATKTVNLDVAFAATPTFGIGTTFAYSSTSGFDLGGKLSRFTVFMPSAVLTKQLNGFYQLYAEYVYVSKLGSNQSGRAFVDYGVQHLLGKHTEIDVELGNSITANRGLRFKYLGIGLGVALH
ncbi:MAG: hypothetical protein NVSMB6_29930 [Burkholderiaceae bacterium]